MESGQVTETRIGELYRGPGSRDGPTNPLQLSVHTAQLSPDGTRLVYIVGVADSECIVVDGHTGPVYRKIKRVVLSPDGKHVAYCAVRKSGKMVVVRDGKEGEPFGYSETHWMVFSPDSRRLAYWATNGSRERTHDDYIFYTDDCFVVVDGVRGRGYQRVGEIKFSPGGSRVAYVGTKWGGGPRTDKSTPQEQVAVIDGKESAPYHGVEGFVFSPHDRRVAFSATRWDKVKGAQEVVVIDGEEVPASPLGTSWFEFSPDSRRYHFLMGREHQGATRFRVVLDGRPQPWYRSIDGAAFSPDSKRFAYIAKDERHPPGPARVVVNGQEGAEYQSILSLHFSPNSRDLVYVVHEAREEAAREFVVVNGKKGREYSAVGYPRFSPDGSRMAYAAQKGAELVVVVNGEESRPYELFPCCGRCDLSRRTGLCFSPDGKHLAFRAQKNGKFVMVKDGDDGPKHDRAPQHEPPVFCPSGEHFAYVAGIGDDQEKWTVVLEDTRGPIYDRVRSLHFDDDNVLRYLGERDGLLYYVEDRAGPLQE